MRSSLAVLLVMLVGATDQVQGGTILSLWGGNNGGYAIGGLLSPSYTQVVGFSFTLARSYENVDIAVPLMANAGSDTVKAYLVRGSLPQADASEVAATTIMTTAGTTRPYDLFDGLSLAAGEYSLVLDSTTSSGNTLGWQYSIAPQIVQNDGVTYSSGAYTSLNETRPTYAPDSPDFRPTAINVTLNISITGDVVTTAVPEPASLGMASVAALIGGLGVAVRRRRVA